MEKLKCRCCGEPVRTWKQQNFDYPTYIDDYRIERHESDNVLMCLNEKCLESDNVLMCLNEKCLEHGIVHKYLKDIKVECKVEIID